MIVPDTSAWVEFFRRSGHAIHLTMRSLIDAGEDMATTGIILMELLAGASSSDHEAAIRDTLQEYPIIPLSGTAPYEEGARVYHACRSGGETVRGMTDCLIAAVAIRASATLLHNDRDFDVIARHTDLQIHPLPR